MIRIILIITVLATVIFMAAVGCSDEGISTSTEVGIELSGVVSDASTMEGIEGVMILFSAYHEQDIDRSVPLHTDTTYTDSYGYYELNTIHYGTDIYGIVAEDVDGEENGGYYKSKSTDIYLSGDSPSYDEASACFILSGIVLLMGE